MVDISHTLTNPGGEDGAISTGWTVELGSPERRTSSPPGPHTGTYYFYGGTSVESKASQEIDLATDGVSTTDIDNEILYFQVNWWQASYSVADKADIRVRFKDSEKDTISETTGQGLWAASPAQVWRNRQYDVLIPANTRYIDVIMHMYRTSGTNNDGYIDDITCKTHTIASDPHSTNFSEYTTGNLPSDWTEEWGASSNYTVIADGTGDSYGSKNLQCDITPDDRAGLSWDDISTVFDADIVARCRALSDASGVNRQAEIVVRGAGNYDATDCYYAASIDPKNDYLRLIKCSKGAISLLSEVNPGFAVSKDTWYWVRLQAIGPAIKAKMWAGGPGDEPGTWNIEVTDYDVCEAGWVGVTTVEADSIWDYFAYDNGIAASAELPAISLGNLDSLLPDLQLESKTGSILSATLPDMQFTGSTGATLSANLPDLQLDTPEFFFCYSNITLTDLRISATASGYDMELDATLPDLQFTATASQIHIGTPTEPGSIPKLPDLQMLSTFGDLFNINLRSKLPDLEFTGRTGWVCRETQNLPDLQLTATCTVEVKSTLNKNIPILQLTARTGYNADADLKLSDLQISATGTAPAVYSARLSRTLPGLTLSASFDDTYNTFSLNKDLIFPSLSATLSAAVTATLNKHLPTLKLVASVLSGGYGTLTATLPDLEITAYSYSANMDLDSTLPNLQMQMYASGDSYGGVDANRLLERNRFEPNYILRHSRW